jgi:hypothetical protein
LIPSSFGVGSSPFSAATGDINGDGKLDLMVANQDNNNVSVLLGNGDGTFQAAVNYGVGNQPLSMALGDFNGDGIGGGGDATTSTSSVPRCSRSCPPGNLPVPVLPMNRQFRIKVSSAGIAGSGRETRCDTGR